MRPARRASVLAAGLILLAAGPSGRDARAQNAAMAERAEEALAAAHEGRFVRAREKAAEVLRDDPDSAPASLALGLALHEGEGNIPLALRHYQRARRLVEGPHGIAPAAAEELHREILYQEMRALSDLGRYEELLALTSRVRLLYDPHLYSADVWPLMKLGRVEEARKAIELALASEDRFEEVIARNGLCALDGYEECLAMLQAVQRHRLNPGLALRNAGVSAAVSGRLEEAERLLVESTRHPDEDTNPWRDLVDLYALEARFAEALGAARRMIESGRDLPPRERQYSRAEQLVAGAKVLLLSGRAERALVATTRAIDAPDRAAHWSGSAPELQAEGSLLHRAVLRTLAGRERERSLGLPPHRRGAALLRASWLDFRGWLAGRRVLPLLLAGGLRGSEEGADRETPALSGPLWLTLDAVQVFGAGPALSLIASARREQPDEAGVPARLREAQLAALETEAHCLLDDEVRCIETGRRAREGLPPGEVLLRARIAARMADAAWRSGDGASAWALYDEVLSADAGTLRRLGLPLPASRDGGSAGDAGQAIALLLGGPRFVEEPSSPFVLTDSAGRVCLSTRDGARLGCSGVDDGAAGSGSGSPGASGRDPVVARIAAGLMETVFSPRVDLSQQDLGSLDGSTGIDRGLDVGILEELLAE